MKNQLIKSESDIDNKKLSGFLDIMGLGNKLDENEKQQFFEISQAFGLNPFKREIYCNKYGDGANAQLSIIVGFEVYIKRAERSGMLDGWDMTTNGSVENGDLKAIITIYRKDRGRPFIHDVYYSEYVQKKRDGTITKFWSEKPITMIKKVAMAQGFRMCFSDELGGMPYTSDEIDTSYEIVEDKKYIKDKLSTGEGTIEKALPELTPDHKNCKYIKDKLSTGEGTIEKALPELTPDHKNWKYIKDKLSTGEGTIEKAKLKYIISEENVILLLGK